MFKIQRYASFGQRPAEVAIRRAIERRNDGQVNQSLIKRAAGGLHGDSHAVESRLLDGRLPALAPHVTGRAPRVARKKIRRLTKPFSNKPPLQLDPIVADLVTTRIQELEQNVRVALLYA